MTDTQQPKAVPREPTVEMIDAGLQVLVTTALIGDRHPLIQAYRAMYDAAPQSEATDTARLDWLAERLFAADFEYAFSGAEGDGNKIALIFAWPASVGVGPHLRANIDAAMQGGSHAGAHSATGTTKGVVVTTEPWLQVTPQYMWHGDLVIEGNYAALRALASALREAAEGDAAQTDAFASDGEGYTVKVLHKERPSDFSEPTYLCTIPGPDAPAQPE